ncbi:hypothetical protein FHT40_003420 [Mycolicibacterium sp. BK556]|uniref:hypothetical protein n=1 Tax=Mycobacteriaceae TaxID=1762 RepID=UPI001060DCE1|nr:MULTISPECIES: hypothetical protein [Mycobacteriaceae]MBB3603759.1 hypothetical protein [Mycolicibacterium sp. BK556]MBB3633954.1 hypothetical protein [Mycolicibacterium sp. BK607]MBB3751536.1 hypothetical protein [Mycolicibacterium sp. BK634]TDO12054.1 hypothetical protein EV580_3778 [Mycobacterium sp. BK086]
METFRTYLKIQAACFVFGIVGPIFLVVYFAAQPDLTLRWMYYWGLIITAIDMLIALGVTDQTIRARQVTRENEKESRSS